MLAARAVGDCGYSVSNTQSVFGQDAMSDESCDRVIGALHVGELNGFGVVIKFTDVRDLASGFGVDGRVIEDYLRFGVLRNFTCRAVLGDDGFNPSIP